MEVLTHGVTHVLRPQILVLLVGLAVFLDPFSEHYQMRT